jgi:hypothetical protein
MKHKVLKIRWATWVKLRKLLPGKKGETMNDYLLRITGGGLL